MYRLLDAIDVSVLIELDVHPMPDNSATHRTARVQHLAGAASTLTRVLQTSGFVGVQDGRYRVRAVYGKVARAPGLPQRPEARKSDCPLR